MYVVSLNTCPDCGSEINPGSKLNKSSKICFHCSKVFHQEAFVKINSPSKKLVKSREPLSVSYVGLSVNRYLITNPRNIEPLEVEEFTMEETHDVLYIRAEIREAKHILKEFIRRLNEQLPNLKMDKSKSRMPSWETLYPTEATEQGPLTFTNL